MGVDVYFFLDAGISVEEALLGTTWEVPSTSCTVYLPRRMLGSIEEAGIDRLLRGPDLAGAEVELERSERHWQTDGDDDAWLIMWGRVSGWHPKDDRILDAYIPRLVAVARWEGGDDDVERLAFAEHTTDALQVWFVALKDWLEVVSGKVLGVRHETASSHLMPTNPLQIDSSGRAGWFARPEHGDIHTIYREPTMSLADWQAATLYVAAGAQVPLAHDLLREARHAQGHGDGRRAVLDAASACEVALSESIRERVHGSPDDAIDRQFRRMSGVVELYDFQVLAVRPIAAVSHGRLAGDLAGVRNRVAHAGHRPTKTAVKEAIAVATALVAEVAPLPQP